MPPVPEPAGPAGGVWCVVPCYNHAATVRAVVEGCRTHVPRVLVVDDGSTDADVAALLAGTGAEVVRHPRNLGKGAALRTALAHVLGRGGTHLVTIDADGQHDPADLPGLLRAIAEDPEAIVVGARDFSGADVPRSSRFGRRFSNFWLAIETGRDLPDTQSGFRAYPAALVARLPLSGRRYDFEVEVLARAAWAGLPLRSVEVSTTYSPPGGRVTHFRRGADNARLAAMHARLVGRRLLPWPARRLVARRPAGPSPWREPRAFLRGLLREHATPGGLAAAAAVGTVLAVLPLVSVHTLAILYVATRLNLNRATALAIQNLFVPPFTPFLCIQVGYRLRYGRWLDRFPRTAPELAHRLWEWLLGSLLLAPVFAAVTGGAVYLLARAAQRRRRRGRE